MGARRGEDGRCARDKSCIVSSTSSGFDPCTCKRGLLSWLGPSAPPPPPVSSTSFGFGFTLLLCGIVRYSSFKMAYCALKAGCISCVFTESTMQQPGCPLDLLHEAGILISCLVTVEELGVLLLRLQKFRAAHFAQQPIPELFSFLSIPFQRGIQLYIPSSMVERGRE